MPNFHVLEFHHLDNELWNSMTVERDLIQNGRINVPREAGLGVRLDESVVRDGNIVTARTWHDNAGLMRTFLEMLDES